MQKKRLDQALVGLGLVASRSQAEDLIRRGQVKLNNKVVHKTGTSTSVTDKIEVLQEEQFVSRAALKLKSVAELLGIDFKNKTVLDVGSSTGGFTEFALSRGAEKVIAVDVGTEQLHPKLRTDWRIELHEKTDIRQFKTGSRIDLVVADVSFISLRDILPHVSTLVNPESIILVMCKPQFEAGREQVNKGVIKNSSVRRRILQDFEAWLQKSFVIINKADSRVAGTKGNVERFYLLRVLK